MLRPRASFSEQNSPSEQSAEEMAGALLAFLREHPEAVVLEDGKTVFELAEAQHRVNAEHGRCTLQLWSDDRNLVRSVVAVAERKGSLRLSTTRFGHAQTKLLEISAEHQRREPGMRQASRQQYLRVLQRVLTREFADWSPEGFRAAMDLERSFGPAYARGLLVRGREAWAVIGAGKGESQATVDGILTLGVLWLHHCREKGDGRRLCKGLRVIVPKGMATLTLARLPWMNAAAAQWELFELDEKTEELVERDAADQGNLRTRLVQCPDEGAGRERFAGAIDQVMELVPQGETCRVEQRLRSSAELAFLLHGLEFARARIVPAPAGFTHRLEVTVGMGAAETVLGPSNRGELAAHVAELFSRRDARIAGQARRLRPQAPGRGIGAFTGKPAHHRLAAHVNGTDQSSPGMSRLELRARALASQQDPLFRAAPERWLESVLRENLAPLTRSLAPAPRECRAKTGHSFANEPDPDNVGNRDTSHGEDGGWSMRAGPMRASDRVIPHFDPCHVYTQVPAIAGASDRGMLDLLGVTDDGRLAVIELKASDDLQLALQGLDYWVRVRHHHATNIDPASGQPSAINDLQRHGYFRGVALSPLPPRLYLVAPALRLHPATETVLRYLSPRVEWTLLALDERWRQEVRVVWRKTGGGVL